MITLEQITHELDKVNKLTRDEIKELLDKPDCKKYRRFDVTRLINACNTKQSIKHINLTYKGTVYTQARASNCCDSTDKTLKFHVKSKHNLVKNRKQVVTLLYRIYLGHIRRLLDSGYYLNADAINASHELKNLL